MNSWGPTVKISTVGRLMSIFGIFESSVLWIIDLMNRDLCTSEMISQFGTCLGNSEQRNSPPLGAWILIVADDALRNPY